MIKKEHIVVIGAGFSGLSTAAYLSQQGYSVSVLEKNNQPGGRAFTVRQQGYRFELGPSWYMMPDVFEDFFADFNKRPSDYYHLTRLDPSYRVFFAGAQAYDLSTLRENATLFSQLEPGASVELEHLIAKSRKLYKLARANFLNSNYSSAWQLLSPKRLRYIGHLNLLKSYHGVIAGHFRDPRLQQILEFMGVFLGSAPQNVPAFYQVLAYVDMGMGIWYPDGGFTKVARSFARLAKAQGVRITYNQKVTSIEVKNGRAVAVRTGRKRIACDAVVGACDYHHIETKLLKPAQQTYSSKYWQRRTLSPSALIISLGLDTQLSNLEHHNLFFDTNWDDNFKAIFKSHSWPDEPLFYVSVPSKSEATCAPPDCETVFILVPIPAGIEENQGAIDVIRQNVYARIGERAQLDIAKHIVREDIRSVDYFEDAFNAYKGNAFGLSQTKLQSALSRPKNRSKKVKNLFYASQYTGLGIGVPLCVLSGKAVAKAVMKSL